VLAVTLRALIRKLVVALAPPPEEEKLLTEEQLKAQIVENMRLEKLGRRVGSRPWYQSRPRLLRIPENWRYYEDVHGTKATLGALQKAAKKSQA
jgi:hypothetical protein